MINRMVLQGRLVADPELRHTASDIPVASFRVAWSEKYKETENKFFLSCTAWRAAGEFVCKYFNKGQEIAVEGPLHTRTWQDSEGSNRSTLEMIVDKIHFCGSKASSENRTAPSPAGRPVGVDGPGADEGYRELSDEDVDLPF